MTIEFDKKDWKDTKAKAKELGVKYLVFEDRNLVIAYKPSLLNDANGKMIEVSVAWCAEDDKFKKKHGKYIAASKLLWVGEYIQLPLNQMSEYTVQQVLSNMFVDF